MKHCINAIVILLLLLSTGCTNIPTSEKSQEISTDKPLHLVFPTAEEFNNQVSDNIQYDKWVIGEKPKEWGNIPKDSTYKRYYLYNESQNIICTIVTYISPANTNGINVTFFYTDITEEGYRIFNEKELPQIFNIIAYLSDNADEMSQLTKKISTEHDLQISKYSEGGLIEWGEQHSNIYATAKMTYNEGINSPVLVNISLVTREEYNYINNIDDVKPLSVEDMVSCIEKAENIQDKFIVYGSLNNFEKADSITAIDNASASFFPRNTHSYLKATLKDDTASISVYIAPTALTEKELYDDRIHVIQTIRDKNTKEVFHIILRSVEYNREVQNSIKD